MGPSVLEFAQSYVYQLTPGWLGEKLCLGGWSVLELGAEDELFCAGILGSCEVGKPGSRGSPNQQR